MAVSSSRSLCPKSGLIDLHFGSRTVISCAGRQLLRRRFNPRAGKVVKLNYPFLPSFPFLSDRPTATGGLTAISPLRITVIIAIENSKVWLAVVTSLGEEGEGGRETPGVSEGAGITPPPSSSGQA